VNPATTLAAPSSPTACAVGLDAVASGSGENPQKSAAY